MIIFPILHLYYICCVFYYFLNHSFIILYLSLGNIYSGILWYVYQSRLVVIILIFPVPLFLLLFSASWEWISSYGTKEVDDMSMKDDIHLITT